MIHRWFSESVSCLIVHRNRSVLTPFRELFKQYKCPPQLYTHISMVPTSLQLVKHKFNWLSDRIHQQLNVITRQFPVRFFLLRQNRQRANRTDSEIDHERSTCENRLRIGNYILAKVAWSRKRNTCSKGARFWQKRRDYLKKKTFCIVVHPYISSDALLM